MIPEGTKPNEDERYLSLGAVAGRFLVRIDDVHQLDRPGQTQDRNRAAGKDAYP